MSLPPYTADPTVPAQPRRLRRSRANRRIAGVAGGLADYFGVDATWVRIAFVASILLPGPQVLLYLILWLVIPQD
ncbi:PspC domain-containing protein [Gordonia sp. MP11Mi]|uniref:Phage shock protein PspC N-terminal domain-containing protein n=1 Tax=Gordonia sp. MP11Mi TaxID=3022769 RepID=A0AA97CYF4_9ACTN